MDEWRDELRRQAVADELRRRQLWGPADHKLSWTDMCKQLSEANPSWAKEIGGGEPLFMSEQIYKLKLGSNRGGEHGFYYRKEGADILHELRPEDAIHIPQLRLDSNSGKIIEWNRSLCDLTGISPAQVVGKLYAEVLEEWLPNLTKEYKEAAVEWINGTNEGDNDTVEYDESCREDYLFPLPLPIKYDSPSKYELKNWKNIKPDPGNGHYYEYRDTCGKD
jgi:PAS domain-containing protein